MQSDIHHSDDNGAKEATESSQLATSFSAPSRLARRSFLRNLGLGVALLAPGAALLSGSTKAFAANGNKKLTRGDVGILQFPEIMPNWTIRIIPAITSKQSLSPLGFTSALLSKAAPAFTQRWLRK